MDPRPTIGDLGCTLGVLFLLVTAFGMLAHGFVRSNAAHRLAGRLLIAIGIVINLGQVIYRNLTASQLYCPIEDNYDSVLLFVVMLGGVLFYLILLGRRPGQAAAANLAPRRPVIDLILLPLMVAFQVIGVILYFEGFRHFGFTGVWRRVHLASLLLACLFAAVSAVAGAGYLLLNRSLRRKAPQGMFGNLPSLERLERLIGHAVTWSFILLTIAVISGIGTLVALGLHTDLARWAKLYPAFGAWIVYGIVVAVRFAPRFRGRPVAWLCILGFGLLMSTYLIVQWQRTPPLLRP